MKKIRVAYLLIFTLLISCSSDDKIDNDPVELQLSKLEQIHYDSMGMIQVKYETIFESNKIVSMAEYNNQNEIYSETTLLYNSNNLLQKTQKYSYDELINEKIINYDSSQRIIKTEFNDYKNTTNNYTVEFVYNSDNTIIGRTKNSYGHIFELTYRMNDIGLIVEEISDGDIVTSIEYNGLNPIKKTDQVSEIVYSYMENSQNPLTIYYEIFGDKYFNRVLFHNNLDHASDFYAQNLIIKRQWEEPVDFTEINEYELYENGLPKNSKRYYIEGSTERFSDEYIYYYE